MKAYLHATRISPKKANLIAKMVRGKSVEDAQYLLEHTHKKGARLLQTLLASAVANARENDKQDPQHLFVKILTVNKAQTYHRGVPMARGRMRSMRKFLSHISLTLGVAGHDEDSTARKTEQKGSAEKKATKVASQRVQKPVQHSRASAQSTQDRGKGSRKSSSRNTSPAPRVSVRKSPPPA
ncbi:50S ribosomal protein L22 [Candidatus Peregrinibacteria bacterium CG10_big_fil_rev_8_21_14_0_10_55_24]|nr:MAG: 50S ribosomal protein L22 [Candidatus Peregrinibacteria bacterium CG10_big_fil_rev_8_21_14_0_10_55_24]